MNEAKRHQTPNETNIEVGDKIRQSGHETVYTVLALPFGGMVKTSFINGEQPRWIANLNLGATGWVFDFPPEKVDEEIWVTTHGTWCKHGQKPKTSYVYEISFPMANGHPDFSRAVVKAK